MDTRRPLLGVVVLFFVNGTAFGSWLPRLPELRDRLDLGLDTVGVILAMAGVGGLAGSGLSGWLVGRLGARWVAVWPALLLMAALPAIGAAPSGLLLAGAVLVAALVDALADVGMNALAVRAQLSRGRSIFTRLHALWSMGSLVGAAVSTAAAAGGVPLGYQLVGVAVVGAGSVVWAMGVIPPTDLKPRTRPRAGLATSFVLVGGTVALVEGVPHDWSAIFLTDEVGTTAAVAGSGFLCLTAGMVAGRVAGDRVVDRFGPRHSIYGGLGMVAVALTVMLAVPGVVTTLAALALWGLGISVVLPLLYRLAGSHRGFGEGSGLAALTIGNRLGFSAGPGAVGTMAAAVSLPTALGAVVAIALVASTIVLAIGVGD